MLKKINIREITIIITVLVTLISSVFLIPSILFLSFVSWFFIISIVGFINFLIIRFFLEKYVFKKIKIIYKLIFDSKKDKLTQDIADISLEDVNSQVMEWARNTKKEIASLKTLEEYRKNYVGNISHELKTPIFSIQAYLHTLLEGGLYDKSINIDYLQRAINNVDRLQNIVEDLDIINKLESGKGELDIKKFDLKALVEDIIIDISPIAAKKKINISIKGDEQDNVFVLADRESIRQVVSNLLINSIKYGKEGGKTKVSFYDIESEVLTEISDNGIGIEEGHLRHVFDRFYRVDSSRSREQGGSGLGLSIVKHIVEAHDQTITARSTKGMGSTFGFTLSRAKY